MTKWEYYYLDGEDEPEYNSGLFMLERADVSEENPVEESVPLGSVVLDFRDGELVGIEIYQDAEKVISPSFRKGSIDEPESFKVQPEQESVSLIDMLKEKGVINK